MNKRIQLIIILGLFSLFGTVMTFSAQSPEPGVMTWGETVFGSFDENNPTINSWVFTTQIREMFSLEVKRIGGQYSPTFRVFAPDGTELTDETNVILTPDSASFMFDAGMVQAGDVRVDVIGATSNNVANPNEYTLTLTYEGVYRENADEDLVPLPTRGAADIPILEEGTPKTNEMGVAFYGNATLTQPDVRTQLNRWVLDGGAYFIDIDNASPLSRGLKSMSIVSNGVGFTLLESGAQFYADESITKLTYSQGISEIMLASGRTIKTDFYRIRQIQSVADLLVVTTTDEQRLLFYGNAFDFQRRGGINGEGPNSEPVNIMKVDGFTFDSDFSAWHTVYFNSPEREIRVLYNNGIRFISEYRNISAFQRGNQEKPELDEAGTDTRYIDVTLREETGNNPNSFGFAIQPYGMGDVVVNSTSVTVTPLDKRNIVEDTVNFASMIVEDRAVRVVRRDSTIRLNLPDKTDIETPVAAPSVIDAPPADPSYRPNNVNNLGTFFYDYHPQVSWDEFVLPVNSVNGNLYYAVNDISLDSHALELEWTRYYNSQSPSTVTPAYLLNSGNYLFGQLGQQWRHSYQYELDLRYAPLGEVWLTLPDGSRHIFRTQDNPSSLAPSFRSQTLMSWQIFRNNGLTADWTAKTGDGVEFSFNRAGLLTNISDMHGSVLLLSPAPRELVAEAGYSGGFFVTERYGRRIEAYTDENGLIRLVSQQFETEYQYDSQNRLVRVNYPSVLQNQPEGENNYTYSDNNNLLVEIRDTRSPYHPAMRVQYTLDNKVELWEINHLALKDTPGIVTNVVYGDGQTTFSKANGEIQQQQVIRHDIQQRITERILTDGTNSRSQAFEYDTQNGRLYQIRQINGARYTYRYDENGYLTLMTTPNTREYSFTYEPGLDGVSRWLTSVRYPNNSAVTYTYDPEMKYVATKTQPFDAERQLITSYTYDEFGRIASVREPNPASPETPHVTEYAYDEFGYLSSIQTYDEVNPDIRNTMQTTFDIGGRLTEIVDWRGQPISIEWDNQRELMTAFVYGDVSRLVNRREFQYDEYSNLIEQRSQDLVETYTYNGLNLLDSLTKGIEGSDRRLTTYYRYDAIGNLIERTEPYGDDANSFKVFTYGYNGINELTSYTLPSGDVYQIAYQIEGTGVETSFSVASPDGQSLLYVYDTDGRLKQIRHTSLSGAVIYNYQFDYDSMDNLVRLQSAHGNGLIRQIAYNAANLPISTKVGDVTTSYTYNHAGLLASITNPDGIITSYDYDAFGNIIRAHLPDKDNSPDTPNPVHTYQYDEIGNLISFVDAAGNTTTYTYDELNRLTSVNDPFGQLTEYTYDDRDNIISVDYPDRNSIRATYNESNLMTEWFDATGASIVYDYDQGDRLTRITERNGVFSTFTYDILDNMVATSIMESRETLFSYDNANRLISKTNALGQTTTYNYNSLNTVSQILDSLGNSERFTWTGLARLNVYTNQAGESFGYVSDDIGRLQQMNTPAQLERYLLSYSNAGLLQSMRHTIENNDKEYKYTYYPNGLIASLQAPEMDNAWLFEYDNGLNLVAIVTPKGERTQYTYDALGRILSVVHPNGATESWQYDAVGNVTQHTAANGVVSTFAYDANNRVNLRTDTADGVTREYSYFYKTTVPQLTIVDPNGVETQYHYNEFGNVIKIDVINTSGEEEESISVAYEYDDVSNLVQVTYPAMDSTGTVPDQRFSYNALNQLTRYLDFDGGSWAYGYDALGNVNQVNDPLGNFVSYEYDSNNRINSIRYSSGAFAQFRYNTRPNTLDAPENHTRSQENRIPLYYSFDFNGDLIEIEHTPGSKIIFQRDDLGQVTQMTTAKGVAIGFDYNHFGQMTAIRSPENTVTRTYDALGNMLSSEFSGTASNFSYDSFGYLKQFQQDGVTVDYVNDTLGYLQSSNSSVNGLTEYTYDGLYRLVSLSNIDDTVDFTRNDIGWNTMLTYGSGVRKLYRYSPGGRVNTSTMSAGANNYVFNYTRDDAGNVIRVTRSDRDTSTNSTTTRDTLYTYGRSNELIGERWLNENNELVYAVTYAYDTEGNRTQSISYVTNGNPIRTIYVHNQYNQLTDIYRNVPADIFDRYTGEVENPGDIATASERLQFTYDNAGNLATFTHAQGQLQYRYDVWNRIVGVTGVNELGESVDVAFAYNSLGQLIVIVTNGERHVLGYEQGNLVEIRNETSGTRTIYHYSPEGDLLWRKVGAELQYPVIDGLGNIRLWVNVEGQSVDGSRGVTLNAFGEVIQPYDDDSGQPVPNTPQLLFNGQIYEPASGLHLMGVRAYLPQVGRFIQRDPVRHDPQSSLYTFVQNRPTYAVDFSGMIAEVGFTQSQAIKYPINTFTNTSRRMVEQSNQDTQRVMQTQAIDDRNLLAIAYDVMQSFNNTTVVVDSASCLRVLGGQFQHDYARNWLPELKLDGSTNAWIAPNQPDPETPPQRDSILDDLNRFTQTALNTNRLVNASNCDWELLPQTVEIQPSTETMFSHADLRNSLTTGSLFESVGNELSLLLDGSAYYPALSSNNVEPLLKPLPIPTLIPDKLYSMQVDTYQLMQQAILPMYQTYTLDETDYASRKMGVSLTPIIGD